MASELEISSTFIPALYKPAALLPIARHRQSLLYLVETYPVTIVVGQTGSGKTTQLPQYLDQAGWCADGKAIAVTQVLFDPLHHGPVRQYVIAKLATAASGGCHHCRSSSGRGDALQIRRRSGLFDSF
jgi:ATP-dependent RNA helicase DDX35